MTDIDALRAEHALRAELARLAEVVASHDRALYPLGTDGLPAPVRRDRGNSMDGYCWDRDGWSINLLDEPDSQTQLFVHTPQSMGWDPGDVVPVDMAHALWLSGALLAGRNYAVDELRERRRREKS